MECGESAKFENFADLQTLMLSTIPLSRNYPASQAAMTSFFQFFQFFQRNWQIARPPSQPTKNAEALRIGLLGASTIAFVPSLHRSVSAWWGVYYAASSRYLPVADCQ
jgi:hypothetical protein